MTGNNICIHYESCGGCNLQHLNDDEYYAFKQQVLRDVLQRLGCADEMLKDVVRIGAGTRRRADFKVAVSKGDIALGFHGERSNALVDIEMCPVLEPQVFAFSQAFKAFLGQLKKPGNVSGVSVTNFASGVDVVVNMKNAAKAADMQKIVEFAKTPAVLRLSVQVADDDLKAVYKKEVPVVSFGGVQVEFPVGGFLQATQAGQDAIVDFVLEKAKGAVNVVDLYSGCGTYSLPLARAGAHVVAFEGDYDMVFALNAAARKAALDDSLSAQSRDLFKKPLRASELKAFDMAVINPPRNGALPQTQQLAEAELNKIVMVSCSPQTFERDAKALLLAGWKLLEVVPIDQFYLTKHLELVAYFEK